MNLWSGGLQPAVWSLDIFSRRTRQEIDSTRLSAGSYR